MSETARKLGDVRERILANPDVILEDAEVMRALIAATEASRGENVVDLRGIAMQRLETRLDRLEDTHRSVIAAAYENLAGTNQVHRAILSMLDPLEFEHFVANLAGNVADILRVDAVRLVLESAEIGSAAAEPVANRLGGVVTLVPAGWIDAALGDGAAPRPVTLRQVQGGAAELYGGDGAGAIRSEALMRVDFGPGCLPGLLVLGSADADLFRPNQGTDLLAFFAGVFERVMRRWLA